MKKNESVMREMSRWPVSWMGDDNDLRYGIKLVELMVLFVTALIKDGVSKPVLREHMDNLWLFGGELIRSVSMLDLYGITPYRQVMEVICSEGGPPSRHLDSKAEQRSFDATCARFHAFLKEHPPRPRRHAVTRLSKKRQ